MAVPAAKYLVCFDKPQSCPTPDPTPQVPIVMELPALEENDIAEQIEEAHRRGKEEALALARKSFESEMAEEKHRFDERMQAARTQWTQEIVEKLEGQISAAFQAVETQIAEGVSRVLRPVMFAALREQIVASMVAGLAKLRSGEAGALITISGPGELLDSLRQRIPELENSIEFIPGKTIEVKATADQTVLESQLEAWFSMLETSVG